MAHKNAAHGNAAPAAKAHRRPNYLLVFLALAILTATEIAVASLSGDLRVPALLLLSLIKALLVILYYMHLRYDSFWFSLIFFLPFILIIPLILTLSPVIHRTGHM